MDTYGTAHYFIISRSYACNVMFPIIDELSSIACLHVYMTASGKLTHEKPLKCEN